MIWFRLIGDDELALEPAPRRVSGLLVRDINPDSGPVLVTVEYLVAPERAAEFSRAMQPVRIIRLRDGAIFWGLFFDSEQPGRFVEYFLVESWLEHLRQHERGVVADVELEQYARSFHLGPDAPVVSHQVSVESISGLNADLFVRASDGPQ